MTLKELQLGTSARLFMIPKSDLKTDSLTVSFSLPLDRKRAADNTLLPAILTSGSEAYPTRSDLAGKLDSLYNAGISCRTGKCGEHCVVMFSLRCLETQCVPGGEDLFSDLVRVFCETLLHPKTENGVFCDAFVTREKKNLTDAIRAEINNKAGYAMKRLDREMFASEPYGIPMRGTLEDVANATPQSIHAAYLDMLAHAPVVCHYVGKRSAEDVCAALSPLFGALEETRCAPFYAPRTQVLRKAAHPTRIVTEDAPIRQSRLCIGYRSGMVLSDGDFYKFALFNELLGGSASSLLFTEVREARGLCYDISSFPEAQKGILYISCGISADAYDEAKAAIDAQIAAIARGEFSPTAFEAAKKSLISGYREIEDNASALTAWYANRLIAGLETAPAQAAEQVASCTPDDVARCACGITEDTVFFLRGTAADGGEEESDDAYDD